MYSRDLQQVAQAMTQDRLERAAQERAWRARSVPCAGILVRSRQWLGRLFLAFARHLRRQPASVATRSRIQRPNL